MSHSHQHGVHRHPGGDCALVHHHDPSAPHPAQAVSWSILRMPALARMAAALAVSAGLWAIVLVAMR